MQQLKISWIYFCSFTLILSFAVIFAGCNSPDPQELKITQFSASVTEINPGEPVTLSWTTAHADTVSITPDTGTVDVNGNIEVRPLQTKNYTLTASRGIAGSPQYKEISASLTITVTPTLSITPKATPSSGDAPLNVKFSPGINTQSAINNYYWDMNGDGTDDRSDTVGHNQNWVYSQPGDYTARLRVIDSAGHEQIAYVTIKVNNAPPEAAVSINASNGTLPLLVRFNVTASDNEGIANYAWDFNGDGTIDETTNSPIVQHSYNHAGVYQARVRVTDTLGASSLVNSPNIEIRVVPVGAPIVAMRFDKSSGNTPLAVSFNATASKPAGLSITSWNWDFDGDGTIDSTAAENTTFSYNSPGIFYPALTVIYSDGTSAKDIGRIHVEATRSLRISSSTIMPAIAQEATINISLGGLERSRVLIENAAAEHVKTLLPWDTRSGDLSLTWDGRAENGSLLPNGPYYAILEYGEPGTEKRLDLRLSTGGTRYNPTRTGIPSTFSPYDNNPLVINFTLPRPTEVTAFMGLFNTNTRLRTFMTREPLGAGTYSIVWNGDGPDGRAITPVPNNPFLFGIWGYSLPDNVIFIKSGAEVSSLKIQPAIVNPSSSTSENDGYSHIHFTLSHTADIDVIISDVEAGSQIRKFTHRNIAAGEAELLWDGKNDAGIPVAPGRYRIGIRAIDALGNTTPYLYGMTRVYY